VFDRLHGSTRVAWIDVHDAGSVVPDISPDATTMAALRVAYAELSEGHRAVVALHLYAGYSVDETARSIGIPVDTVRSRLRAARRRMRDAMNEVTS
jgi:DNA-directed RNA polymerase specialized sigma24 family protein